MKAKAFTNPAETNASQLVTLSGFLEEELSRDKSCCLTKRDTVGFNESSCSSSLPNWSPRCSAKPGSKLLFREDNRGSPDRGTLGFLCVFLPVPS